MTGRKLMVGHVKFTAMATVEQLEAVAQSAEAAGIRWDRAMLLIEKQVMAACRQAADATIEEIAGKWTDEQWHAAAARFRVD